MRSTILAGGLRPLVNHRRPSAFGPQSQPVKLFYLAALGLRAGVLSKAFYLAALGLRAGVLSEAFYLAALGLRAVQGIKAKSFSISFTA